MEKQKVMLGVLPGWLVGRGRSRKEEKIRLRMRLNMREKKGSRICFSLSACMLGIVMAVWWPQSFSLLFLDGL